MTSLSLSQVKLNYDFLFQNAINGINKNAILPYQYEADFQFDRILKDIFAYSRYRGQQFNYSLTFSTQIEYKENALFHSYRLILQESKLIVLKTITVPATAAVFSSSKEEAKLKEDPKKKTTMPTSIEDIYHPIVFLDFNLVTATVTISKQSTSQFTIKVLGGNNQLFKFRITNKDIFNQTVYLINAAIYLSKGSKINLLGVSLRKNYFKNYYITEREFREKAKTGDMILFRGFEFPAVCQRCLTGSPYDHVALLQKTNGSLFVYESTSKDGCRKRLWRDFMFNLWNLLYDKMVFRELIINANDQEAKQSIQKEIESKADEYLNQTQGKSYSLSFCSIICGSSKQSFEENNEWDKSPGFSCSALLTGAYVKMGVISYFADSRSILPGRYAQDSKLPFNPSFALGPEKILDFSL